MARGIFGFFLTLVFVSVLVGIGAGVYQAGVAQGIVDAGRFPAGATVPVAGYGWHGPDLFGLFFGILFLFLIFGLIRAAFFGGRGWGRGYGHHGYGWGPGWGKGGPMEGGPDAWREERERRMSELHQRLHERESQSGGGTGSA